jgi:hypothetical protein
MFLCSTNMSSGRAHQLSALQAFLQPLPAGGTDPGHKPSKLGHANLAFLMGHAELMRGAVSSAVKLLHEALAGVEMHDVTPGLRPASCFALAEAHAKLGQAAEANEALSEARACVPPDYLFMQTALDLATGWALAASGSLTDAVAAVRAAANDARDRAQPTHELSRLEAAGQWGDASVTERARELADMLSLPLASAVARHAASLQAGDGEGLLAASADYRAIGDRSTAADVAAQAAVAFSRAQQRKRGLYAAALARELADACGGLCTPVLRTPVGVPLTSRERQVSGTRCCRFVQPRHRRPARHVGGHRRGPCVPRTSTGGSQAARRPSRDRASRPPGGRR